MTTTIKWPESLQGMMTASKTRTMVPTYGLIQPRSGPAFIKYTDKNAPAAWDTQLKFTQMDAATFWTWFDIDLKKGRKSFIFPINTEFGLIDHEVMFVPDSFVTLSEGDGLFTYSAKLLSRGLVVKNIAFIDLYSEVLFSSYAIETNLYASSLFIDASHPVSTYANVIYIMEKI